MSKGKSHTHIFIYVRFGRDRLLLNKLQNRQLELESGGWGRMLWSPILNTWNDGFHGGRVEYHIGEILI